jgi:ADP-heptose:LPS heptosyltransferase
LVGLSEKAERGRGFLRKLDRWIGVPLLFALSLFHKKRARPERFQSVGICVFAAIGDALLASSLIAGIKKAFPDVKITIFATQANKAAFNLVEGYDDLVLVPITKPSAAIQKVREYPVDVMIDTSQWPRIGALVAGLSRSHWTIGFETEGQSRHFLYDFSVKHSPKVHELTNFGALLSPLGVKTGCMPPIAISKISDSSCLKIKQPYVVLHPWASGNHFELREWPRTHWVELAKRLTNAGYGLVISGGPSDEHRAKDLCDQIGRTPPGGLLSLAGQASLLDTAAYLKSAAAVVSVNTGTMHLAALLGAPLVALHGPTNPDRWGPHYPGNKFEHKAIILGPGKEEGGAYLNLGFEYPDNPSYLMDQISVESVISALRKFSINIA